MAPQKRKKRFSLINLIPAQVRGPFRTSVIISLILILTSVVMYPTLQPVIPLFYSLPQAAQQLVSKEWIFLVPGIGITMTILHFVIAKAISHQAATVLQLFCWTTVFLQMVLLLIFTRIIIIIY